MSVDRDRLNELGAGWALGDLDAEERAELRRLVEAGGEAARERLAELRDAALHLPLAAEPVEAPAGVLDAVMTRVETGRRPNRRAAVVLAVVAAAAGLLGLLALGQTLRNHQLQERLKQTEWVQTMLMQPGTEVVTLEGLEEAPEGDALLIWNSETDAALLQVCGLAPAGEGQQYRVWIFAEGQPPVSPGPLPPDATYEGTWVPIKKLTKTPKEQLTGILITLEPDGPATEPGPRRCLGTFLSF